VPLLVASLLMAAAIAAVWWQARRDRSPERVPLKITRLTTSGQIRHAVISADGRYVAYAAMDDGGESLWIRHVESTSRVEVVPTAPVTYLGLTFGPDTNSIYYVVRERSRPREGALYRVAVLGGASPPRLILTDIDTPVAVSPDGSRMAYVVSNQLTGQSALMIAGAEGAGAAMLAARHSPEEFTWAGAGPVWTPAGASVITAGVSTDGNGAYGSLIEVQTSDGSQKPLGSRRFSEVGRIAWERNGSGFIGAASERLGANQLWRVSYPSGDARQITNDESKNYLGVSLTADGSVLATVQRDAQASVWLADDGDATRARQITEGKYDGRRAPSQRAQRQRPAVARPRGDDRAYRRRLRARQ